MTTPFPPKPWQEGDTFTNDTTGVEYVYQGDQWISTGGPDVVAGYLPLTGGTMVGDLDFAESGYIDGTHVKSLNDRGGLEIRTIPNSPLVLTSTGSYQEIFAVYSYDPDGLANRERTFQISANGNIRSWGSVIGKQVNTTKLTSGQNSDLTLHRGSGADEKRKMLIGSNSVNFDVPIKLLPAAEPTEDDHVVPKSYVDAATAGDKHLPLVGGTMTGEIGFNLNSGKAISIERGGAIKATIHSDGTFTTQRTEFNGNHLVTKKYVDDAFGDYLPLTGGDLSGLLNINVNSGVALSINNNKIKFWSSGAVELNGYTNFKENELVTKAYVDGAIGDIDIPDVDLSGYLPLGGGQMTGPITSNRGAGDLAFRVETNGAHKLTIWNDGVIESTRTGFSDNHLVTKKYVDENAGGFTPGEQVAKLNGSAGVAVGGFYIQNGNVFCKIS